MTQSTSGRFAERISQSPRSELSDPAYATPATPLEPTSIEPGGAEAAYRPPPYRTRYRLAAVLFVLTFFTTTTLGTVLYLGTRTDETTGLAMFLAPSTIREVWTTPTLLRYGLSFSIPLLLILGSHELGHFLACRRYRVPSTAPYFLPAPLGIGTFGAFIRIRARIATKSELFDIGIAGPIAGFVVLVPFLIVGVAWSRPGIVAVAQDWSRVDTVLYHPGTNLALWLLTLVFHGRLPENALLDLHPFALAAWVGMFATALNLLPMGQLDGGHVLYAVAGRLHRPVAWVTWIAACALGYVWLGWLVICFMVLVVMGIRHPPVLDVERPLDPRRRRLAWVAALLLVLCFTPIPLDVLPLERVPGVIVELGPAIAPANYSSSKGAKEFAKANSKSWRKPAQRAQRSDLENESHGAVVDQ